MVKIEEESEKSINFELISCRFLGVGGGAGRIIKSADEKKV